MSAKVRPNDHFFLCSAINVQGLSGSHAEWLFIFCSMSKVWWVSGRNGRVAILCLFVRCRVSVLMSSVNVPRSCRAEMAEWPSCVYLFRCRVSFFVVFVVLSGSFFVDYIVFYYLLTHPVSLNLQQNSKKGTVSHKCSLLFCLAFWYGMSALILLISIYVLNFAL